MSALKCMSLLLVSVVIELDRKLFLAKVNVAECSAIVKRFGV